jgi:purine catabolism regulator
MVTVANPGASGGQDLPIDPADRADPVPLGDLLTLPALAGAAVVAGAAGIDRAVSSMNVMEVPDVLEWVKPGELLVTTGFPLVAGTAETADLDGDADPTARLVALVRALHERDVAALGVKVGRYLDGLPDEVVRVADELRFPVVRLPAALGFDDLIAQVYARIRRNRANTAARADALHTTLSQLVLSGADIDRIAREVSRVLGVGILVTSTDGRERGGALADEERAEMTARGLADDTGRIRVERISPSSPYREGEARVLAIPAGGTDLARLVCISPDHEIGLDDGQALERTAIVVALLLTRQRAVALVENKYRGDFLRDVFLGRAGDPAVLVEHARTVGWNLDRPSVVVAAELDPPEDESIDAQTQGEWQERFAAAWRQVCESRDAAIPTADFFTEVVTLLPVPDTATLREVVDQVVAEVAGDRGGGRRPFSVGVSRVANGVKDLPAAYHQARRATRVGRRLTGGRSTTWFDDLGVHRLIALVPDTEEVSAFVSDVLGPLAEDTTEAADLRATLQVLLDTNLNVAEAARQQFFHYNTMRYRITKLEALLGPFTSDPGLRLDLAVALQALDLRH